jgi:DNA repair protein RadA/Sms
VETVVFAKREKEGKKQIQAVKPEVLSKISGKDFVRIISGISEFDRVLGSGAVPGSVILLAGDPGIGKSTLLLQICGNLTSQTTDQKPLTTIYVSGEESSPQIKLRADRLGISSGNLFILPENNVDQIIYTIEKQNPTLVIIDSIQAMYLKEIPSSPGGILQVTSCASKLIKLAKEKKIPIILIGHVTKSGNIAGPKVLEHQVDVVLYLEGERYGSLRVLRGIKNRFGATDEVGIFEMVENGMKEVKNPSQVLLQKKALCSGSVVVASLEGSRPLLVELQALTSPTVFGYPKRTASGIDFNRLQLLLAVLTKRAGLKLGNQDVYINIVGGFKIYEPALDLGICLACASTYKNKPVDPDMVVFGEVGLSGELRGVRHFQKRILEAEKLGFKKILMPASEKLSPKSKCKILTANNLSQAIKIALL